MLKGRNQTQLLLGRVKTVFLLIFMVFFTPDLLLIAQAQSTISMTREINKNDEKLTSTIQDKKNNKTLDGIQKSKIEKKPVNNVSYSPTNASTTLATTLSSEEKLHPFIFFIIVILLFVVLFIFAYWIYYQKSAKAHLRKNYNRIEINEKSQQFSLFFRHQPDVAKIIDNDTVSKSQIYLNEQLINQIDLYNSFNNKIESELRHVFECEYHYKMIKKKIRHIRLDIHQQKIKRPIRISIYMREGDNRLTKASYKKTIEQLINWCWLINTILHPHNNEKRRITVHSNRTSIHPNETSNTVRRKKQLSDKILSTKLEKLDVAHSSTEKRIEKVAVSITDELNQLVLLQQQGFLSLEEFNQAKAKLLSN